jgi:alpha-glucosidase (family GH31 glycosyl hydrolase)
VLALEAKLTTAEGTVGLPYVSHDIGSFNGRPVLGRCDGPENGIAGAKDPPDLYARWVQFGAFQPLERLHSNHGARLPWEYPQPAQSAAAAALRLREALVPYLYTLARETYDTGLPLTRALYLQWPRNPAAYRFPTEYTLGRDVLVSPVTAPGDPAPATVWIPPGRWVDYFTGHAYRGPRRVHLSVPLQQMPVFLRAGSVLVTQPAVATTAAGPARRLVVTAYPGHRGSFRLYDDHGTGFGYRHGRDTWTPISHAASRARATVTIGSASGRFRGAPKSRAWVVRFADVPRPRSVRIGDRALRRSHWSYQRSARTITVRIGRRNSSRRTQITAHWRRS